MEKIARLPRGSARERATTDERFLSEHFQVSPIPGLAATHERGLSLTDHYELPESQANLMAK